MKVTVEATIWVHWGALVPLFPSHSTSPAGRYIAPARVISELPRNLLSLPTAARGSWKNSTPG